MSSSSALPIGDVAQLAGHANTRLTAEDYRKELLPMLTKDARPMVAIVKDGVEWLRLPRSPLAVRSRLSSGRNCCVQRREGGA